MNTDEKTALKYLEGLNIGKPNYEPDGNIPPDFSFDNNLGIEVRRLNQNYFDNSKVEGLEELQYRINKILDQSLKSFDSKHDGDSYWVFMQYRRPINHNTRSLLKQFTIGLQLFLDSKREDNSKLEVNNFIDLRFIKTNNKFPELFKYGGGSDFNTFGYVNAVFIENVSYCIFEKSKKILGYKSNYTTWWLILVNHLYTQFEDDDITEIRKYLNSTGDFDKVKVLNPSNLKIIFEL